MYRTEITDPISNVNFNPTINLKNFLRHLNDDDKAIIHI